MFTGFRGLTSHFSHSMQSLSLLSKYQNYHPASCYYWFLTYYNNFTSLILLLLTYLNFWKKQLRIDKKEDSIIRLKRVLFRWQFSPAVASFYKMLHVASSSIWNWNGTRHLAAHPHLFKIEGKKLYDLTYWWYKHKNICVEEVAVYRRSFLKPFFPIREQLFSKFPHKILVIILIDTCIIG